MASSATKSALTRLQDMNRATGGEDMVQFSIEEGDNPEVIRYCFTKEADTQWRAIFLGMMFPTLCEQVFPVLVLPKDL